MDIAQMIAATADELKAENDYAQGQDKSCASFEDIRRKNLITFLAAVLTDEQLEHLPELILSEILEFLTEGSFLYERINAKVHEKMMEL
jgi:hypothetical protein